MWYEKMVLNVITVNKSNSLLKETKCAAVTLDIVSKAVLWPQEDAKVSNIFIPYDMVWGKIKLA